MLADTAMEHKNDHALAFTDLHNVLSLARVGRFDDAGSYIASMEAIAHQDDSHLAQVLRRVGIPICESLVSFGKGEYRLALETILLKRPLLIEVGASNAQRDLVTLIAIEAAHRAKDQATLMQLKREREFSQRLAARDFH
jgi:hypothetical protein